jgi:hypothetical protein
MTKAKRERKREKPRNPYSLRPLIAYGLMCYGLGALTASLISLIFLR